MGEYVPRHLGGTVSYEVRSERARRAHDLRNAERAVKVLAATDQHECSRRLYRLLLLSGALHGLGDVWSVAEPVAWESAFASWQRSKLTAVAS